MWIVVPFSRPENAALVLENVRRQRGCSVRLAVVENGRAIGRWPYAADLLLRSDPSPGAAKNEALEAIRKRGGGLWTTFDDDDYYGPDHVAELELAAVRADAVGRYIHWVRFQDGLYLFNRERAERYTDSVCGATITARAEDSVPFSAVALGEDVQWCKQMKDRGARIYACTARQHIYRRLGNDHAWSAHPVIVRRQLGPAFYYGDVPDTVCHDTSAPAVYVPPPSNEEVFKVIETCSFRTSSPA